MKANDRYAAHEVVATCRCCGQQYPVLNLSLGGMFLACEHQPRVGEPVTLDVKLPGHPAFKVKGSVAWNNKGDSPRAPELPRGIGIREQQTDLPGKLALLQHLRQHETDKIARS